MKRFIFPLALIAIAAIFALLTGCASPSSVISAIGKDPAAAHISVVGPGWTVIIDRANPGTNQIQVGPNGITTRPQ